MPRVSNEDVQSALAKAMVTALEDGRPQIQELSTKPVTNIRGAYAIYDIDLNDANFSIGTGAKLLPQTIFGLMYAFQGSDNAGILDVAFEPSGGRFTQMKPGMKLNIPGGSDGIVIRRNSASPIQGTARLVALVAPDVDYTEILPAAGFNQVNVTTESAALGAASYAGAAPSAATDGQDLYGVVGVRSTFSNDEERVITAASYRFWFYDPIVQEWIPNRNLFTITPPANAKAVQTDDYEVAVPRGRVYCQWVSVTFSGSATTYYANLFTSRGAR